MLNPAIAWALIGTLLVLLELTTGEFTLLTMGLACWAAAAVALAGFSLTAQVAAAVALAGGVTALILPWVRRRLAPPATPTPVQSMIGQPAEVISPIADGRAGKVKLDGVVWRAESDLPLETGRRVLVMEVSGTTLRVLPEEPVSAPPSWLSGGTTHASPPVAPPEGSPSMQEPTQPT
ncbi:MAG: NfeD family protein [Candidatus Sericytochromatia bacterium]|nr:NfeD family protein [Candidatus Sericytochromatia bacterium]